jgi:mannose-6-phosphate isomerase-like protein (cupin superfamily)
MIKSKENTEHYFWGEQCDSWVFHNSENLVVKNELMPPKTSEKLHFHELAQQFFYILKGEATFYVEGEKFMVKSGEGIAIEANKKHYIANETSENLEFLVVSNPSTDNDRILI